MVRKNVSYSLTHVDYTLSTAVTQIEIKRFLTTENLCLWFEAAKALAFGATFSISVHKCFQQ